MADPANTARRQQAGQQGWITSVLTFPIRFAAVMLGALLLSILIELAGLHLFWADEGGRHSERMLKYELAQLSEHFKQSRLFSDPARTADVLVARTYQTLLVDTAVAEWARDASERPQSEPVSRISFKRLLGLAYVQLEDHMRAAAYTIMTFLVRLLILFLTLPLFGMAALVGLVDGLVRRDLRKFGAGRESGFLYHRAKATLMPLAVLPWMAYLSLPISIHPLFILLPSAVLLGTAVNLTAGAFKKYL
jgi:integrating conjugative element membrane protein (TIGR03747 family)